MVREPPRNATRLRAQLKDIPHRQLALAQHLKQKAFLVAKIPGQTAVRPVTRRSLIYPGVFLVYGRPWGCPRKETGRARSRCALGIADCLKIFREHIESILQLANSGWQRQTAPKCRLAP